MSQKNWLSIIFLLLVADLSLVGISYFQFAIRSPGQFYGSYDNPSQVDNFALVALERPNVSTKALLSWVTLAATATFTFDFVNYKDQLNSLQEYFTNDGYDNFLTSLQSAGTISTIEEKKLILSAVAIGPAIILTETELNNKHTWRIQVPLLVRYQSASVNEKRFQVIEMLITQVSTRDAPKGIGIAQYIAMEAGAELST